MKIYKRMFKESLNFKGDKLLLKNTDKAKNLGSRYGQDVEPSGFYCLLYDEKYQKNLLDLPNYKLYSFNFKNPLIIEITSDTLISWKSNLSEKYNAKGKRLTVKLLKDGYDSIITFDTKYKETGEVIILDVNRLKEI